MFRAIIELLFQKSDQEYREMVHHFEAKQEREALQHLDKCEDYANLAKDLQRHNNEQKTNRE